MDVLKIYKNLFGHFGPQGWWPIFDTKTKKCKYFLQHNCRGRDSYVEKYFAFEISVGAILTQNTAWKNVEKALTSLIQDCQRPERAKRVKGPRASLTPQSILSCQNLEQLIQPAGYYNQKAKKLRIFANWWLQNERTITSAAAEVMVRENLLKIWGIGKETADSILLYAFNQPAFVIDTYTKRLCKEFGIEFKTYDEYRKFFENALPRDAQLFNEYHALIVAWGKLYIKDKNQALKIVR